jgi:yecA family protein
MLASRALTDPPEAHGTLAGALCAATDFGLEDWLREVYTDGQAGHDAAQEAMQALYAETRESLASGLMQFQVLLPGDDVPIADRATALGQWCQGFLYGLGTSAIPDVDTLPEQISEIVRDLSAITQVSVDAAESDETNEEAYTELVEFVRVGVQLLFDELARYRDKPEPADATPEFLH